MRHKAENQLSDELVRLRRRIKELENVVAAHKQAEEKSFYLASIVESSDDAIIGKTLDGIITSWNKGAEKLYGYKAREMVSKPIALLVPQDRQGEVIQFLDAIKRGERVHHYETVRRKKDGSEIEVSLTVTRAPAHSSPGHS